MYKKQKTKKISRLFKALLVITLPSITILILVITFNKNYLQKDEINSEVDKYEKPLISETALNKYIEYGPKIKNEKIIINFLEDFLPKIEKFKKNDSNLILNFKREDNQFYIQTVLDYINNSYYFFELQQNY